MSWTYTEEYYKNYTRETWNESASGYATIARNLDQFNPALLRAAAPRPGDRVLDVATGHGEPAITLAAVVGPKGKVLGIDLAERMLEVARARAKALNLDSLTFETMDAEALTLADGTFDLATCRFGLMIFTDPNKALREMRRVLTPGGRVAATVWSTGDRVPALDAIIAPMLEHAEPDENGYLPTPYELGGPGTLAKLLAEEGFTDVREERLTQTWHFRDEDEYLDGVLKGTPVGHSLLEEPPEVQEAILRKTRENLKPWRTPSGTFAMPGEAVVVSGRR